MRPIHGLFVRAAACPPCDSLVYALDGDELICEACATHFDALTGEGIEGACIDYPKAEVAYEISGGLVAMTTANLVAAWDETLAVGSVPLEPNVIVAGDLEEDEEENSRPACCRQGGGRGEQFETCEENDTMKTRRILPVIVGLAVLPVLAACAAPDDANASVPPETTPASPSGPVEGTWVDVALSGDVVTMPLSLVEEMVNTHFSVSEPTRRLDFMAYVLDGTLYVRANACPPCRSRGFALDGDVLVCDTCATTFKARDGSGIKGACVDYPKADAAYTVVDGVVTMSLADLAAAYEETLVRG